MSNNHNDGMNVKEIRIPEEWLHEPPVHSRKQLLRDRRRALESKSMEDARFTYTTLPKGYMLFKDPCPFGLSAAPQYSNATGFSASTARPESHDRIFYRSRGEKPARTEPPYAVFHDNSIEKDEKHMLPPLRIKPMSPSVRYNSVPSTFETVNIQDPPLAERIATSFGTEHWWLKGDSKPSTPLRKRGRGNQDELTEVHRPVRERKDFTPTLPPSAINPYVEAARLGMDPTQFGSEIIRIAKVSRDFLASQPHMKAMSPTRSRPGGFLEPPEPERTEYLPSPMPSSFTKDGIFHEEDLKATRMLAKYVENKVEVKPRPTAVRRRSAGTSSRSAARWTIKDTLDKTTTHDDVHVASIRYPTVRLHSTYRVTAPSTSKRDIRTRGI